MYIAKNNARAQLAGTLLIGDLVANLEAGKGALFAVTAPEWTYITAFDGSGNIEHMKVTARATDALTIERGKDGTAAREWPVGTYITCRPIAAALADYAVAPQINGATAETSIADADEVGFVDASASNVLKKITWANVVATLKTYFDGLYRAVTGNVTLAAGAVVVFEGTTDDAYETTLAVADPTADRTVTLPDETGTVALMSDVTAAVAGAVTSGMIIDFGGSAAPTGYLACDGASYLRADYPNLFTAIGVLWGSVDATHFNVPNIPAGYAAVQTAGTVGASTAGEVKAHTHVVGSTVGATSGGFGALAGDTGAQTSASTGGAANKAAGVYVLKCIKT